MQKIAFHTLGCKLNFAETSTIRRKFESLGYDTVSWESSGADIAVINSCSVTENADRETRQLVRNFRKRNPGAVVCITGCYAQLKPEAIAEIEGVSLVVGSKDKFRIPELLKEKVSPKEQTSIYNCSVEESRTFQHSHSYGSRTRAFLKVQDGCDYPCTYCTIPLARGGSRNPDIQSLVEKAKELADAGVLEIVLTGVNTGDFGRGSLAPDREENFLRLIDTLDRVANVPRFRISSIEPNLLSREIIDFVAKSSKFVNHFHIPLQSGSDRILAAMKRRYRSDLYRQRVDYIHSQMPDAAIGADVITGFPGEDEAAFLETYRFLESLPLAYLHVFTYSERANTEALLLPGKVDPQVRKERTRLLRQLSDEKSRAFYTAGKDSQQIVLWESAAEGFLTGYTGNYIRVKIDRELASPNSLEKIVVGDFDGNAAAHAHPININLKSGIRYA